METAERYDLAVIGGGPAGLAAAIAGDKGGAKTLLIEREERLGGILKQCVHDGFGVERYGEKLAGPEYAQRDIDELRERMISAACSSFVTGAEKVPDGYRLILSSAQGIRTVVASAVVLATGCRERTARQVAIQGTRPAGIFTAGTAQHLVNIDGQLPGKRCVILGSGDIGLIMARRLTLEGAQVIGVYEAKSEPSGLARNLAQCLDDFNIPLYLSYTVTQVFGTDRLTGVEIAKTDDQMRPIPGTQQRISCDTLIISVGLIPENELAEALGVRLDRKTKGPYVDDSLETLSAGIFCAGNCLSVNDLVDNVSENGMIAGAAAARYAKLARQGALPARELVKSESARELLSVVPQYFDLAREADTVIYFRTAGTFREADFQIYADGQPVFRRHYRILRPTVAERLKLSLKGLGITAASKLELKIGGRPCES